jgi:hypothetical protein
MKKSKHLPQFSKLKHQFNRERTPNDLNIAYAELERKIKKMLGKRDINIYLSARKDNIKNLDSEK